jgi:hypothetical protein
MARSARPFVILNLDLFLENSEEWDEANKEILSKRDKAVQKPFAGLEELQICVGDEIRSQEKASLRLGSLTGGGGDSRDGKALQGYFPVGMGSISHRSSGERGPSPAIVEKLFCRRWESGCIGKACKKRAKPANLGVEH